MGQNGKVVVNLATGLEDPERVTIGFLVGGAAAKQGKDVVMFLTKDAVRLAIGGTAEGIACDGCPPLERLFAEYTSDGGKLLVCPICFDARQLDSEQLVDNAQIGGATPLWEWIGDGATVFSY
jgi:predicted peroxiredoxin